MVPAVGRDGVVLPIVRRGAYIHSTLYVEGFETRGVKSHKLLFYKGLY